MVNIFANNLTLSLLLFYDVRIFARPQKFQDSKEDFNFFPNKFCFPGKKAGDDKGDNLN